MQKLNAHVVTFNCARNLLDIDTFASHLFIRQPKSLRSPDLIVLSLQEVAPIAHAFLGGNLLNPYLQRFVQAVNKSSDVGYEPIAIRNVGMTALIVLAESSVSSSIRLVSAAGVGVGHWRMGNKGAVGVRLSIDCGDSFRFVTLVAAHLAPFEHQVSRRNEDWKEIVSGLVFLPTDKRHPDPSEESEPLLPETGRPSGDNLLHSMFSNQAPLFFAGDLNYRTHDVGPSDTDAQKFPQPGEERISALRNTDQLERERSAEATLHYLDEVPIDFPPTYKYAWGHSDDWPGDGSEPSVYHWAKHRFPSWCDRILFSSELKAASTIFQPHVYDALPLESTSDHRPVVLSFTYDLQQFGSDGNVLQTNAPPFRIYPDWMARRRVARRLEIAVGALAYLALTWEGNILLLSLAGGSVGGWLLLRSMLQP